MPDEGLGERLRHMPDDSARFWELSGDLLCSVSSDGRFRRLNPAWTRMLGWTIDELRSGAVLDLVHPDDHATSLSELAELQAGGYESVAYESRLRCKDGGYRTILWSATSIPDEGLVYATGRDVTVSRRAQEELERSERFLQSVLVNLPTMVFVKDADELRFVRMNRAEEELLGCSPGELVGKNDHDLFPKSVADAFVAKDREAFATEDVVDIPEELIEIPGNGTRVLHTRKIGLRDETGKPLYLLGISEDITDRKIAERAAGVARAEAERANQAKSEFLSRMSHELRTPLNAVIGFGQLLELDELEPHQTEAVQHILGAGRHLLDLINEVLDISRIESGTMTLSLEPVHLASVLDDAVLLIRPLADAAQVRLVSDSACNSDVHVVADEQRLQQVLLNLLSNAVKYNRAGGKVSVRCLQTAGDRIEIAIADTGMGMRPEQVQRLFEPFDRLGAERTDIEGTGLGLSLVKGFVEAMAGSIEAESEPGVGTTMRVRLAAVPAPGESREGGDRATRDLDGRTIVHIDDNPTSLQLVERLLDPLPGLRLFAARKGREGVELIRTHTPDVILLDLHLSDGDGREFLGELRRDPRTAAIPVVVLSAAVTPDEAQRLRAAGAAEVLAKPVDAAALLKALASAR
jgi:PAS domain S-box-containing protein